MRVNTTLVINPKGGSGKTTIAINLASCLVTDGISTTLMDYDPQASSMAWLRSRAEHAPRIHGANGAPEKYGRLRSFEMYVPPQTRQLIIDAPAGSNGLLLYEMLERAHCVLVPVVPSIIDIRATETFVKELLAAPRVRSGEARVGIVANKVRPSMPAYQPLLRFLESMQLKPLTRLLDSDMYLRAAESGVGIFEMDPGMTQVEQRQFKPIVDWVLGDAAMQAARVDGAGSEVKLVRRVAF
jgi:chromosome partitioning protein